MTVSRDTAERMLTLFDIPPDVAVGYMPKHPEFRTAIRVDLPERIHMQRGYAAVEIGLHGDAREVWKLMGETLRNLPPVPEKRAPKQWTGTRVIKELIGGCDYRVTVLLSKERNAKRRIGYTPKTLTVTLTYCGGSYCCEYGTLGGSWSTREWDHRKRRTYWNLPILWIEDAN